MQKKLNSANRSRVAASLLTVIALLFCITPLGARSAALDADLSANPEVALKFATIFPKNSPWGKTLQGCADYIAERSLGQVKLSLSYSGSQGDESVMRDLIQAGRVDGALLTGVGLGKFYKPILVLQLPGLFANWNHYYRGRALLNADFNKALADAGYAFLGWTDIGVSRMMSKGVTVKTPDDLKGKRSGIARDDLIQQALYEVGSGSQPAMLRIVDEMRPNLAGGAIEIISTPPALAEQFQWAELLDHITSDTQAYIVGGIVFSSNRLNALAPELKVIVVEGFARVASALETRVRNEDAAAYSRLKSKLTVVDFSAAEQAKWNELYKQVRQRLVPGTFSPEMIQRLERLSP